MKPWHLDFVILLTADVWQISLSTLVMTPGPLLPQSLPLKFSRRFLELTTLRTVLVINRLTDLLQTPVGK